MEVEQVVTIIQRALVSFSGQTTSDGNDGHTTLVCSDLTALADFDGQQVIITSGPYTGQSRDIDGATNGGTVTVTPAFGGKIVAGINFTIMTGLPTIEETADIMGAGFDTATDSLVQAHDDHLAHIAADYGATEKAAIDLLDDAAGGLADIHTDVGTAVADIAATHTHAAGAETQATAAAADASAAHIQAEHIHDTDLPDVHGHAATIDGHITADYGATEKAAIDFAGGLAEATGTFPFDESAAGEQTVFSVVVAARAKVGAVWLDLNTLTMNNTIRIKHKIDGATYRTFSTHAWVFATDDKGVLLEGFTAYRAFQVTMQCAGGGAAGKNIPYAVV